jgi:hypothetical protein
VEDEDLLSEHVREDVYGDEALSKSKGKSENQKGRQDQPLVSWLAIFPDRSAQEDSLCVRKIQLRDP